MDVKDLNKSQLILLAVLLSFVTSIATGITTVTLMQQAPVSVTAPINRIVRQTVEKIQQVEGKTVTQTVVVKEEDLVVDAIAKNKPAIFSITKEITDPNNNEATLEISAGQGFAVNTDGVIVVDAVTVYGPGTYFVKNESGKFKADYLSTESGGFSFLKIGNPLNLSDKAVFTPPTFGDISKVKAGQKIIVLGGAISSFIFNGDISVNATKSNSGAMVFNLDGEVLGLGLFNEATSFAPIDVVIKAIPGGSAQ